MDIDKFNVLAELVREARLADAETLRQMEAATAAWKAANAVLTERRKVLDSFIAQAVNAATATREG